jgi:FKBP-type peptidyl-prolyl cis-trans isomerase FklB
VIAGLTDAFTGAPEQLSAPEREAALSSLQEKMVAKANAERDAAGAVAKMAGEEFLEANKSKEGVKTLPSGLQYKIVKEGAGAEPEKTDTVTVNYKGTLIDGTVFDSSYDRGEPATFPLEGVIAGWTEALQLMKPGSQWELFVPSDLAYGESGAGRAVPPHAALVFDVELLKFGS